MMKNEKDAECLLGLVDDRWGLIIAALGPCWWDFVTYLQMQLLNLYSIHTMFYIDIDLFSK